MSSILPWGRPSTMSNSTTSPSSRRAQSWASTPPICPPPINAIFFLAMVVSLGGFATGLRDAVDDGVQGRAGTHGLPRLRRIRLVVATQVHGLPLGADQLGVDLGLVLLELRGDRGEPGLELRV